MMRKTTPQRVVGEASAKRGGDHWWEQRLTAVALVALNVWFAASLLSLSRIEYASLVSWVHQGSTAELLLVFVLVVARHSYLGLHVVVDDYVHHVGTRVATLLVLQFAHVLLATAGVLAVVRIVFAVIPSGAGA